MQAIDNTPPKVSIGMPVYNGKRFIREALDSLLAQTFTDFELIISDNASTDGTEAICREYAARDARIRYVRQSVNHGVGTNWQFVLKEAKGDYFMWAADDDRRDHEFLRLATSILDSNQQVGLVFSWFESKNLLTGESQKVQTGFTTSRHKLFRIIFRIGNSTPCLIYGLHRVSLLRQIKMEQFDYWDVFIGYWYELNSSIIVIPSYLFTAGTNGERIPYSIEGKIFISYKKFLSRSFKLLQSHFNPTISFAVYLLLWWLISKNTRYCNQIIKLNGRTQATEHIRN